MVTEEQLDYYLLPGDWPGLRELYNLTTVEYVRWVLATAAGLTGLNESGHVFYSTQAIKRKLLRFAMFEPGVQELFAIARLVSVQVNGSSVPAFKFNSVQEKMIWLLKYGSDRYTL